MESRNRLFAYWHKLYPGESTEKLESFLDKLKTHPATATASDVDDWYKDAVVYALYVDLFNKDFEGLKEKLDYLQELGVNCLWLLPILDSPMRDAGFDIRRYDRIRAELLGLNDGFEPEEQEEVFGSFLKDAHRRGIKVIFDFAINHCSDEHPWFVEARSSEDNPYRDYFIWSKDTSRYGDARIIFKGIEESNWEADKDGWSYFHRFFSFQPDLNYRNPDVLLAISEKLLYWQSIGVDGFRADAIPYLWKEDGTDCENLEETHLVVKFFRAMLDYVSPGTLLLAEACQTPNKVVKYLGDGDECHAAYHFPLMPMIFKSIAAADNHPIKHTLSKEVTPEIPENSQWFSFLRVHDELSLELVYVSEEDRKFIHEQYCHQPEWDFRIGEGISARLSELMQRDITKIGLAYSLMLTLTGTPVVYYGDEFGRLNDDKFYKEQIQLTGKDDTRFLVRGRVDWEDLETVLLDDENFHTKVYKMISAMLSARHSAGIFGRGETTFIDSQPEIIAYIRHTAEEKILVINNLSDSVQSIANPFPDNDLIILHVEEFTMDDENQKMVFKPHGFGWFKVLS